MISRPIIFNKVTFIHFLNKKLKIKTSIKDFLYLAKIKNEDPECKQFYTSSAISNPINQYVQVFEL